MPTGQTSQRPMRADARRNYDRLVATAREVFKEHGPDAPLDEISRRAGVGAGTLYRHFPSRDNLIEAVYRADIEGLAGRAHELVDSEPPVEAFEKWMRHQVNYVVKSAGLAATLKAAIDHDSEVFQLCKDTMRAAAESVLQPAKDVGYVRSDVTPRDLLLLSHAFSKASETATEDEAERLFSVLLRGLRA